MSQSTNVRHGDFHNDECLKKPLNAFRKHLTSVHLWFGSPAYSQVIARVALLLFRYYSELTKAQHKFGKNWVYPLPANRGASAVLEAKPLLVPSLVLPPLRDPVLDTHRSSLSRSAHQAILGLK